MCIYYIDLYYSRLETRNKIIEVPIPKLRAEIYRLGMFKIRNKSGEGLSANREFKKNKIKHGVISRFLRVGRLGVRLTPCTNHRARSSLVHTIIMAAYTNCVTECACV